MGRVLFAVTVTVAVAVHALEGFVTTNVYVPPADTLGVSVVPPPVIVPPDQLYV